MCRNHVVIDNFPALDSKEFARDGYRGKSVIPACEELFVQRWSFDPIDQYAVYAQELLNANSNLAGIILPVRHENHAGGAVH